MEFAGFKNVNIKDEPIDYLENMDSMEDLAVSGNNTVEVDPMNLLEIVAQRCSEDEEQEISRVSGSLEGGEATAEKWRQWIRTYPWLLRRAEGKRLGFCLYCGKNMNADNICHLDKHNCALIHKERQQNYEAFLTSREETLDEKSVNALKDEIDADSTGRVSEELIANRLEKSKALNDFNWKNWLNAHDWLVRANSEDELSTKGYCKYCKCLFDVEFSLTRQRHEQSIKHKQGGNSFFTQENGDGEPFDGSENFSKAIENDIESMDENAQNTMDNHVTSKVLKGRLFDKISGSSRQRLCRVCRVIIDKHSCRKHMKSKLHRKNIQALAISSRRDKKIDVITGSFNNTPVDWSKFTKIHSWICADPDDPKFAYCSYCEKRFMYGLSVVKRALHEKSQSHLEAMKRKLGNREANNGVTTEANGYQQNESVNMEYDGEENEANESVLKRKRAMFNDKWFESNPCYQRNEHDDEYIYCKCCSVNLLIRNLNIHKHERAERHKQAAKLYAERPIGNVASTMITRKETPLRFPWIRRTKNGQVFCKFCRIVLSPKYKPAVHDQTDRHRFAAQKYYSRKNEQDNEGYTNEHQDVDGLQGGDSVVSDEDMKPTLTIHQENGMNWQQKYEWLTFHESEIRQFYGFCNYCKQSVFVPTPTFASKHEMSSTHVRSQMNQRRHSDLETSHMSKTEETHKYRLYKWLLPDPEENRNFGYCKYCKTRVMTEGLMALGHHNSRSHRKATQLYMQNHNNECSDDENSMMDVSRADQLLNMESINPEESGSDMSSFATRLNNAHTEILSLIRKMNGNNRQNENRSSLPGPGHSAAATTGTDLSYLELNGKSELNTLKKAKQHSERNTYDLFFESMNAAVKKLPSDLAAESRIKIMQIVYDLEMRALQRTETQQKLSQSPQRETSSPQTTTTALQEENATSITNPTIAESVVDADAVDDDNDREDDEHQNLQKDVEEIIPDNGEISTNQCINSDTAK